MNKSYTISFKADNLYFLSFCLFLDQYWTQPCVRFFHHSSRFFTLLAFIEKSIDDSSINEQRGIDEMKKKWEKKSSAAAINPLTGFTNTPLPTCVEKGTWEGKSEKSSVEIDLINI